MSACIFAVGADAEQGTKASQVSANLSLGLSRGPELWQTKHSCVSCAVLCSHVSCATELRDVAHVQRLLQNRDPDPRSFLGVTKDSSQVMCLLEWPSSVSATLSPAES